MLVDVPTVPVGRRMPNPFEFIREIREMNNDLTARLDQIIERLDTIIKLEKDRDLMWYGDGK